MNFKPLMLSMLSIALVSCAQQPNKATIGGLTGAGLGAGAGAIIGNRSGRAGAGTAIGAGFGALGGALIGNSLDSQDVENEKVTEEQLRQRQEIERQRREIEELRRQQRYDDTYRRY